MRIFFRIIPIIIILIPGFILGSIISPKNKMKIGMAIVILMAALVLLNRVIHNRLLNNFYYGLAGFLLILIMLFILGTVFKVLNTYFFKIDNFNSMADKVILFFTLFITIFSVFSAYNLRVKNYDISLDKKESNMENFKVTFVSDIHIGIGLSAKRLEKIVDLINKQNSDLVIIGGDLFDMGLDDISEDEKNRIRDVLKTIKSKNKPIFVLGNHDFYGEDKEEVLSLINGSNINILINENTIINNGINVFGVEDRNSKNKEVMVGNNLPTIIVSHKPVDNKSFKVGDLVISGHTHGGQIFPGNILVKRFFSHVYGYYNDKEYQSIVSSGAGFWGFPMRLLTESEIVNINITLK